MGGDRHFFGGVGQLNDVRMGQMSGKNYSIETKRDAIVAVMTGKSVSQVSRETKIKRDTITRWIRECQNDAPTRQTMAGLMFLMMLEGGISLERYRAARLIAAFTDPDEGTPDPTALDALVNG